jgi:hypothetical protein
VGSRSAANTCMPAAPSRELLTKSFVIKSSRFCLKGRLRTPRSTQVLNCRSLGLLNFACEASPHAVSPHAHSHRPWPQTRNGDKQVARSRCQLPGRSLTRSLPAHTAIPVEVVAWCLLPLSCPILTGGGICMIRKPCRMPPGFLRTRSLPDRRRVIILPTRNDTTRQSRVTHTRRPGLR